MLGATGVEVTPEQLTDQVFLPEQQGSLQAELLASTRRPDRIPYVLEPELVTLLAEVAGGTPVLVRQNLGLTILPRWHYAVVIGYDVRSDQLLRRSGTHRRVRMNRVRFQGSWARAGNLAMVAALSDSPPPTAPHAQWLPTTTSPMYCMNVVA